VIEEPQDPFDVGTPVERANSDNPIGYGVARNVEEGKINAIWNHIQRCRRCHCSHHRGIMRRNDPHSLHRAQNLAFEAGQLPQLEAQVPAEEE
jgi:hypothetical protein